MKPTVLCTLLLVCCLSLTSAAGDHCYSDGPGHCSFEYSGGYWIHATFCDWSPVSHFSLYYYKLRPLDYFAGLILQQYEGTLYSRLSCATREKTHCLHFEYNFESNSVASLSVRIKMEGSDKPEQIVWKTSSSDGWEGAQVPITANNSFNVVFRVKTTFKTQYSVFVDNIFYTKVPCKLYQLTASPFPVTTTTMTVNPLITTPSASETETVTFDDTTSHKRSLNKFTTMLHNLVQPSNKKDLKKMSGAIKEDDLVLSANGVSNTVEASKGSTVSSNNVCDCPLLSNKAGVIVGLIVAAVVIVIAVVIVVLLILFKRKQFHICMACCISKQKKEQFQMNASHNVAYSLDAETNLSRNNSDNHRLDTRASSDSPSNCRIPRSSDNLPMSHNHHVCHVDTSNTKTRNVEQKTSSKSQGNPHATTPKACDKAKMHSSKCPGTGSKNRASAAKGQGQDGGDLSPASASRLTGDYELADPLETNRVYHILEKDPETESSSVYHVPEDDATTMGRAQDGVYNSLDFDQKNGVDRKTGDEGKSEEAKGGVYNHLNEGDGDTYNEVHREKRVEVIHGVYSHIK